MQHCSSKENSKEDCKCWSSVSEADKIWWQDYHDKKPKDDSGKVVLKVNDEYNWTMELPVTFHVEVRASDTIADVKAVIQDYIRVPMINQRLRDVNNNICSDRTVLGDLKKKKVSMEIVTSSSSRQRSRTPRRSRTPPGSWE